MFANLLFLKYWLRPWILHKIMNAHRAICYTFQSLATFKFFSLYDSYLGLCSFCVRPVIKLEFLSHLLLFSKHIKNVCFSTKVQKQACLHENIFCNSINGNLSLERNCSWFKVEWRGIIIEPRLGNYFNISIIYRTTSVSSPSLICTPSRIVRTPYTRIKRTW